MGWHNIKRRRADILFSNYIRNKAGWKCESCGRVCKLGDEILYQMEASHYFSRRHESTRFDTANVVALCSACHRRMGGYNKTGTAEYDLFMKKRLGEIGYKLLMIRANTYRKRDDKAIILMIKSLTKFAN